MKIFAIIATLMGLGAYALPDATPSAAPTTTKVFKGNAEAANAALDSPTAVPAPSAAVAAATPIASAIPTPTPGLEAPSNSAATAGARLADPEFAAQLSPIDTIFSIEMIQGIRDPFQVPTFVTKKQEIPKTELELVQLRDVHLNGVITGPKKLRALVSVPGGKTYFVAIGDKMGIRNGTIKKIRPDAITVIEYDFDVDGKKISEEYELKMTGEVTSLSAKEGM